MFAILQTGRFWTFPLAKKKNRAQSEILACQKFSSVGSIIYHVYLMFATEQWAIYDLSPASQILNHKF